MPRKIEPGPRTTEQLRRLALSWPQGDHMLITGGTGSGKTRLARAIDQIRLDRGGNVVVFMGKLQADETITDYYLKQGFTRWTTWHKYPRITENKVLLWPKIEGKTPREAFAIMKREFGHALDAIGKVGKWTVHIDEGLLMTSPRYLGKADDIGMMYALMRSAKATMITLAQRPAHLPVVIYPNLSHAFVGRASELPDLKRLADMDGATNSRQLQRDIQNLGKHDFLWIQTGKDTPPERVNFVE